MAAARMRQSIGAYGLALCLGAGFALYLFPPEYIIGMHTLLNALGGDPLQHVVGQRYFLAEPWHWPPLVAQNLVPPAGTSIAFTDSIPLLSVLTKLLLPLLPKGIETIGFWLALCWVLQPAAAVFALRCTGETRLAPALAAAMLSLCIPGLYQRTAHEALSAHFLILGAIGGYCLLLRGLSPARWSFGLALMIAALLVHPYLMMMVIAVLAAAPVSLAVRRDRAWLKVALGLAIAILATADLALRLGYAGATPRSGFGYYSMNLLSPFYPAGSVLLPWTPAPIDGTGGQGFEGFQYIGAGLGLLGLAAAWLVVRRVVTPGPMALLRRHLGLVLVLAALSLLAVSSTVYLGHLLILHLRSPSFLGVFRVSARFFWPVTYVLMIAGVALVARLRSATAQAGLLAAVVLIQLVDTAHFRHNTHAAYWHPPQTWEIDTAILRPLIAASSRMTIRPTYDCGADYEGKALMQLLLLASETTIPVNTMYVARETAGFTCNDPSYDPARLAPSELRIFLPEASQSHILRLADWPNLCRWIGILRVCADALRQRQDLARLPTSTSADADDELP